MICHYYARTRLLTNPFDVARIVHNIDKHINAQSAYLFDHLQSMLLFRSLTDCIIRYVNRTIRRHDLGIKPFTKYNDTITLGRQYTTNLKSNILSTATGKNRMYKSQRFLHTDATIMLDRLLYLS